MPAAKGRKSKKVEDKIEVKEVEVEVEVEEEEEEVESHVDDVEEIEDGDSDVASESDDNLVNIKRGSYVEHDKKPRKESYHKESYHKEAYHKEAYHKKEFTSVTDFDRNKARELEYKKVKDIGINDLLKVLITRGEDVDNPNITLKNHARNLMKMLNGERIPRRNKPHQKGGKFNNLFPE